VLQTQAVPLQVGVVPLQVTQVAPHLAAVLQVRQLVPSQYFPEPHEPLGAGEVLQTQPVAWPPHSGRGVAQVSQVGPQLAASSQASQVPALHHSSAAQSNSSTHSTQAVPAALQTWPDPVQSVQEAPHLVSELQVRQLVPLQYLPEPHEPLGAGVALQTQAVPPALQLGVVPLQATQVAPQWAAVLQVAQTPALHHSPEPAQSRSSSHSTQAVPAALQNWPSAVQLVQEVPQPSSVLQVWQLVPSQYLFAPHEPLGAGVVLQTQAVPEQLGVVPEQVTQVSPQWAAVLQGRQVPASHQLPEPQLPSLMQATHWVPSALQT